MGSKPELAGLFLCFCRLEAYCRLSKVQGTPFSHSFLLIPFVAEPKQLPEKWTSYEFHGQDFRLLCYRRWRGKEWRLLQPLFCTGFSVVTCLPSIPPPVQYIPLGQLCVSHSWLIVFGGKERRRSTVTLSFCAHQKRKVSSGTEWL